MSSRSAPRTAPPSDPGCAPLTPRFPLPRRALSLLAGALVLALGVPGCERGFPGAGDGPTIDEDRFVAAMGALRVALDVEEDGALDETRREALLREHGVTGQDLLVFAEVHGTDIPYMHRVWNRVDSIVGARAAEATSPPGAIDDDAPLDADPPT